MSERKRYINRQVKEKVSNILISTLILVLIAVSGEVFYYKHVQKQNEEKQVEEERIRQEEELKALKEKEDSDSFYQKLSDGFDVDILIIGDSIGDGAGASDENHRWANMLCRSIEETYNISADMNNISMGGNTSYAGYARTMLLDDDVACDLAIICYGENDSTADFDLYYEAIIRAVQNRYPKASIISILESSQKGYTQKIRTIKSVADHYGIQTADTIEPFLKNYDELVIDPIHPNDEGMAVYCETVMNVIRTSADQYRGNDPEDVSPINEKVRAFDKLQWFSEDMFTREGNTFTLNTSTKGTIMGIYWNLSNGNNSCQIMIDGKEYANSDIYFKHDFIQPHINVVNDWTENDEINIQEEIRIIFDDDFRADGFMGLLISGS